MTRTMFTSPNGLDDTGYSSAADLVRLTRAAYRSRGFASVVATRFHTVESLDEEPRVVQNRNVLLWLYPGAIGVKTGFTSPAGFCLVGAAQRGDERLVAVVLGAPGEPFSAAADPAELRVRRLRAPDAPARRRAARRRGRRRTERLGERRGERARPGARGGRP